MALKTSARDLTKILLTLISTRFELFSLEMAEQRARATKLLGLLFATLLFLTLAILVFSLSIALYFWPTDYRYTALVVLFLFYLVLGLGCLWCVRKSLVDAPPPFEATLEELRRDLQLVERLGDQASASDNHES
ncbi:MAG TPA: phage holin family protein [Burkholderiaceae bacterium]|nr:phage holin family protein [Burkholderiaceae bacterium]